VDTSARLRDFCPLPYLRSGRGGGLSRAAIAFQSVFFSFLRIRLVSSVLGVVCPVQVVSLRFFILFLLSRRTGRIPLPSRVALPHPAAVVPVAVAHLNRVKFKAFYASVVCLAA
jgi:hypothetical protein